MYFAMVSMPFDKQFAKKSSATKVTTDTNKNCAVTSHLQISTNMALSDAMLPSHESIAEMNQEVQDVHGIMKNNMDNLLERGGKLSALDGRAEDLNKSTAMVCLPTLNIIYNTIQQ